MEQPAPRVGPFALAFGGTLGAVLFRRRVAVTVLSASVFLAGLAGPLLADDSPAESTGDVVTLRGRVICRDALDATTADPAADPCNQPGARFEVRVAGGEAVRFAPTDPRVEGDEDHAARDPG